MSNPTKRILGVHFLDAGPLFCLGGSTVIRDLYDEMFLVDARVVIPVVAEVTRLADARIPPGDPRRRGELKKAAAGARSRYRSLFEAAEPESNDRPEQLNSIQIELVAHAKRRNPNANLHVDSHKGEAVSLHLALAVGGSFVSCDDAARRVAVGLRLHAETFVALAGRCASGQAAVKRRTILRDLQSLERSGIDIGDVVNSVLDLPR